MPGATSEPKPDSTTDPVSIRRLDVAVTLPDAQRPDAGTLRLLDVLCADDRFALTVLIEAPPDPVAMPALLRGVLALEERTLARPRAVTAPAFEAGREQIVVRRLSEAEELEPVDVIVDLSHTAAVLPLSDRARHGLWRLSSGHPHAGLVEPMTGAGSSPVALRSLQSPGGTWETLAETDYDVKFSAAMNRAFQREKAPQLIRHALARLSAGLSPARPGLPDRPEASPARVAHLPGYLAGVGRQVGRRLNNMVAARLGRRPRRFCVRLGRGGPLDFRLEDAVEFDAPPGRYWADPFLFEHEGATYLFLEEYVYSTGLGHLMAFRLDGERLTPLGQVLQTGSHLSYPFVFGHGGEIFMAPETSATRSLEIWRATSFPLEWELHATALDGVPCSDTTMLDQDGKLWIFTNICHDSYGDFGSELHLFRADGPDLRNVTPHPLNPVVIGSRFARGAGRIVRHGGRLLRPSQDNSHGTYGYGLNIMEIEELSLADYRERRVRHITPTGHPGLIGCHHLDVSGDRVVFDIRRP